LTYSSSSKDKQEQKHSAMKHLIPIGFAFAGAFLIGLPLYSHIVAVDLIGRLTNSTMGGSGFPAFPISPMAHLFIPWIMGAVLIAAALFFAAKSYGENNRA
jgi:hypothetical protein